MDRREGARILFNADACNGCRGGCCRGETGTVRVSMAEAAALAAARNLELPVFARRYLRRVRGSLALREYALNGEYLCCFLDPADGRCEVYRHRPAQCRTFPFWPQFEVDPQPLLLDCPGVSLTQPDE